MGEDFRLKWNDHHSVFFSSAEQLCHGDHLTDVTLSCGTKEFSAHKLVLSICSAYFNQLFAPRPEGQQGRQRSRRPADSAAIVYLKDVDSKHMELLLNYMYRGEINVEEKELMGLLATAKGLQIKGLTESDTEEDENETQTNINANNSGRSNSASAHSTKRPAASRPSTSSQQPTSKRIKEEHTPKHESLPEQDQSEVVDEDEANNDHEFPNQGAQFVDVEDPAELIDQSDYSLDGNQSGEAMVYEGDPENPGGHQNQQHSQQNSQVTHDVSEKEFELNNASKGPVVILKEPNHACFACPKAFVHKWMLDRHILTHTGEQPFACSICLRRFSLQASCLRHVRHVHKDAQGVLGSYVVKVSENTNIQNHPNPQILQSDNHVN